MKSGISKILLYFLSFIQSFYDIILYKISTIMSSV